MFDASYESDELIAEERFDEISLEALCLELAVPVERVERQRQEVTEVRNELRQEQRKNFALLQARLNWQIAEAGRRARNQMELAFAEPIGDCDFDFDDDEEDSDELVSTDTVHGKLVNLPAGNLAKDKLNPIDAIYQSAGKLVNSVPDQDLLAQTQECGEIPFIGAGNLVNLTCESNCLSFRAYPSNFIESNKPSSEQSINLLPSSQDRYRHAIDETTSNGPVAHRQPPRWRDIGPRSKLIAIADGLKCLSKAVSAVTINLGSELERQIRSMEDPARWFGKRVSRELKALQPILGRPIDFWLVIETWTERGTRYHFHGAIACAPDERPLIEEALRRAAGKWDCRRGEERQIVWCEDRSGHDDGWPTYACKNLERTKKAIQDTSFFTASQRARDAGRAIFDTWRKEQLALGSGFYEPISAVVGQGG